MEAKLKALKVAELKEILTKSSTPIPSKANKADLIAKILATPDALKLAGGGEAAASAPAPAVAAEPVAPAAPAPAPAAEAAAKPVDDDLFTTTRVDRIDRFDWEGTGAKPDTGASAEAKPAEPASTTESTPAPTKEDASKSTQEETKSADGDAKPAEGGAPKGVDEELERRKARAARFGIPLVENPVSTKGAGGAGGRGRKGKKGAEEKEKPASGAAASGAKAEEKKEVAKKPEEKKEKKEEKPKAVKISAKEADAKLAARAARFGISTAPKAAAGGSADPAEDEKRKKREARFGAPPRLIGNRGGATWEMLSKLSFETRMGSWIARPTVGGALTKERMTDLTTTSASMSHTPARGIPTPRLSSIPTPGSRPGTAQSGIPGRPRSSTGTNTTMAPRDSEAMSMALQDAIKAHDPTRYANNELSPQLPSATVSISGRRSVAGSHRPPSVASTSSSRAKTPVSATSATRPRASLPSRPESRQSNIGRSLSRAGHEFEVGDAVKIESLGMEGTLRFMGEIDGKNGLWAGVELAPAFAGKGKNDGSVAGVRYFTCAPKCGVFTLPNKLSAPLGRSIPRPSSAASHYTNGRTTPSVSGRTTPSFAPVKTIPAPVKKKTEDTTITAGSRASKYVGVTATDLNSRNTASPTRAASTPLGTPKAGRTLPTPRTRPSLAQPGNSTPKAARPYNPMPPPPVPTDSPRKMRQNTITPTSLNSAGADDDRQSLMSALDANNQAIQDKIALLMAGTRTGSNPASPVMRTDDERVAQLEKEIEQLRAEVRYKTASIAEEAAVLNAAIERAVALEEDKRLALERVAELEGANSSVDDVHKAKQEAETRLSEVEAKLKDTESRLTELETQRQAADAKLVEAEEKAKEAETKRSEAESALETLKSSHESELKDKTERVAAGGS
ncbi:CAP-Gly domain-containing protein [Rhizoctonia solani AG-1 IA]|uniref:CAP-Gly domain-containing protein n=1 Tax=Thanatephorus cucumeris (strain AG1-IA) TaxID=983506 RepID=L8WKK1_THACA|nr:CAP-Gly domain-containing protein [Rhizoctonia solani AG-1 IA]